VVLDCSVMNTFSLEIITPEASFPLKDLFAADVPGADGRLTILSGHAALICSLSAGETRLRLEDNTAETWMTGPGTLTVSHDAATLLVTSATRSS